MISSLAALFSATGNFTMPSIPIGPGRPLPLVSLGTGSGQHADVAAATSLWLSQGARAIDTAHMYRDEPDIATGIAESGVPAADVFITTKIQCGSYAAASKQINDNLAQLKTKQVDVTLIHFPQCWGGGSIPETWRALEDAKKAGKTRTIGVSNFDVKQLKTLKETATDWPPAINQCSLSIGYHDDETIQYCDENKIVYMSFSPLCGGKNGSSCKHGSVLNIPKVKAIAAKHNVVAAQIALKWIVQRGRPLATAVARADYMKEDLDLWSWGNITKEEMAELDAI